jgi:hypothetical protein
LNEREEKEKTSKIEWRIDNNPTGIYWYVWKYWLWFASKMIIISKEYGFIKWLVDNDKIDNSKFYDKNILKWFVTLTKEEKSDSIIMNLSISDTPIEDLISYLK